MRSVQNRKLQQGTGGDAQKKRDDFSGWRMAFLVFVARSAAVGIAYGSYGPLVQKLEEHFHTSRALAASGMGLMVLAIGLMCPVVGVLLRRYTIRNVMITGLALTAAGYFLLSIAQTIHQALAIYALLIGPGLSGLSVVSGATMVARWFVTDRGKALGITNMPFFIFVAPALVGQAAVRADLDTIYIGIAAIYVMLIPIMLFLIERPEDIGQKPLGSGSADTTSDGGSPRNEAALGLRRAILHEPKFWAICLFAGLLSGSGVMITTHLVPLATSYGFTLTTASGFLSLFGIAGAIGALAFGWLADRIGAVPAAAVNALGQVPLWLGLILMPASLASFGALALLLGLFCGGISTMHGAIAARLFGPSLLSMVMGLSFFVKVPFSVIAPALAGHLFDLHNEYTLALAVHIGWLLIAGGVALLLLRNMRRRGDAVHAVASELRATQQ